MHAAPAVGGGRRAVPRPVPRIRASRTMLLLATVVCHGEVEFLQFCERTVERTKRRLEQGPVRIRIWPTRLVTGGWSFEDVQ